VAAGTPIIRIDPSYFRPAEVETLLGDPTKARNKLGWTAKTDFATLVKEMMRADLDIAKRDALVSRHGYATPDRHE
jgi:GDPmannose 4,6-dehydratase